MSHGVRLVDTTEDHIDRIIRDMKTDHVRELAWFGATPSAGAWGSFRNSRGSATCIVGDEVLFAAGVSSLRFTYDGDVIWMLSTNAFDRHVRGALRMLSHLFRVEAWKYTKTNRLEQFLPPPYGVGIRFLEWMGWTRGDVVSIVGKQAVHMHFDRVTPERAA